MPRFFFDLRGGDTELIDDEGLEFSNLTEATKGAAAAAEDFVREADHAGIPEASDRRYELYDENRQLVAMVPVGPFMFH
jgi:hypothetical protein